MNCSQVSKHYINIMAYIHNRWINPKTHVIIRHPDIERGVYYDTDTRMLYANFQLLVDHVEISCAMGNRFQTRWQRYYSHIHALPLLEWILPSPRNARQGLHYLRFCMSLTKESPAQADHGREVFRLYKWWTHTRPARLDPWTSYYILREGRDWRGPLTTRERVSMNRCTALEEKYDREDERNLIALMKIRKGLWT